MTLTLFDTASYLTAFIETRHFHMQQMMKCSIQRCQM